ncbi:zinc/iron-chelating domain-containing protein [Desulfohalovibrio reitneri]|uniref:zinc/iron-chelating domain-containing protein n=1 Tax=Desulfohalovibrio reitneri TaxID=1307759 RepID=UPI000ADD34E5|nr:zinc/iron-chelating domain-containing protein [Desulfohalovibrio reitneri]
MDVLLSTRRPGGGGKGFFGKDTVQENPSITPANTAQDPHVCSRCADMGRTCCNLTPGQEELCFPLSGIEMDRIGDFTGRRGWFTQEPNTEAFLGFMTKLFPGEEHLVRRLFHPRKSHYRLATLPDGSCKMLGEHGCRLPREARPYYCRLFPLWFSGESPMALAGNCLAVSESRGTAALLRSMDMSRRTARDLFSRLRMAWGLPPEKGMENVTIRLKQD